VTACVVFLEEWCHPTFRLPYGYWSLFRALALKLEICLLVLCLHLAETICLSVNTVSLTTLYTHRSKDCVLYPLIYSFNRYVIFSTSSGPDNFLDALWVCLHHEHTVKVSCVQDDVKYTVEQCEQLLFKKVQTLPEQLLKEEFVLSLAPKISELVYFYHCSGGTRINWLDLLLLVRG
jgi:hypothetical protein